MRTIAIINQKGGCGKTTVVINLAASLAQHDRRTLLIDIDPQSHCAVGLAVPEDQIERNIYDVLISAFSDSKTDLKSIIWQIAQHFDLAPSGIELAALEPQLAGQDHREECLKNVLQEQAGHYDYVVIDCPPSVGLLTFNALRAADEVIIPVETGYFALHGLAKQLETLTVLREQCRQEICFRVLATMYDVRTKLAREVLNELRKHYGPEMFQSVINFNTKLKEAASFGQAITEYDPASKGMRDFMALAQEIIQTEPAQKEQERIVSVEDQLKAISKSADELLSESKKLIGAKPAGSRPRPAASIQEKIDTLYGVRQNQGQVEFVALYPSATSVQLAGDFNNWEPEQTPLAPAGDNGRWNVRLPLPTGRYHYRYVVDGRWQPDPYNECTEPNPFGEYNSVVEVK
ncbi:MAG: AAA family ATPase [Sedimentisphaerales bacterium]|nr:AAA family ATPase [Sedimentisphaerales bacterium]